MTDIVLASIIVLWITIITYWHLHTGVLIILIAKWAQYKQQMLYFISKKVLL